MYDLIFYNNYMPTHRNLTHVNKVEAVYRGLCINIKVETQASFIFMPAFHTLSLFY